MNTGLIHAAAEMLPDGMTMDIYDLRHLPLYNADDERAGPPPEVAKFKSAVDRADALLIATPEYNYSPSGVLKNALDWISRGENAPLDHKPVAIMGAAGRFGTVRAQLHLRQILLHNSAPVMMDPEVHVMRGRHKFDSDGRLTDEETRTEVAELVAALYDWALRWRRAPLPI